MKSSYELAMERLNKTSPSAKLTDEQKEALAELDSLYAAKIAERELTLQADADKAASAGDYEAMEKARQQLAAERQRLRGELEEKKEKVRGQP